MSASKYSNLKLLFFLFILLFIILPWFNSSIGFDQKAGIASQENVSFYEINPCKISLFEFLRANPSSIYQDHYHFKFNNYSSISCFGRISGLTVINSNFYISIGTNTLVNILFQGFLMVIILSFIKKNNSDLIKFNFKLKFQHNISLFLTTYLFFFSIFSEKRFYEKHIYKFNFDSFYYKLFVFVLLFLVTQILLDIIRERSDNILNYLPYLFIFQSVFSGTNLTFFSSIFIYYGFFSIINRENFNKFNKYMLFISIIWIVNSTESFYFEPGKFRGFTSSVYEFNATIFWCLYFVILLNGIWYIFKTTSKKFKFQKFIENMSLGSLGLLFLGYIGANFPLINFLNYYYFGQQKFGISRNNPFSFNEWSEKISWRGFYTSAETIGEFYGLCLIFLVYSYTKKKSLNKIEIIGLISSLLGIYFSNNRTAMLLAFLFSAFLFIENKSYKKQAIYLLSFTGSILLLYLFGIDDLTYELDFITSRIIVNANIYSFEGISSSFTRWLNSNYANKQLFSGLFGGFSFIGYFLNRSERWGIFFARYNPTFQEFIIGSGPMSLGQVYGETPIEQTETFLLPHSSLLTSLVYFGFLGIIALISLFLFKYISNRRQIISLGNMILIFIFINAFKNDVLNYFAPFLMYIFLIFGILNLKNKTLFRISTKEAQVEA